jgi:hypothetical protein
MSTIILRGSWRRSGDTRRGTEPGHPVNPAEDATINVLPGFKAERIFTVPNGAIRRTTAHPVSNMPSGLLNALNEDELLDLVAYLKGGVP